jgi:hypothetical protein
VVWIFNELNCSATWSTADSTAMLLTAGVNAHALPLCKWLREHGAEWPARLSGASFSSRWCKECIAWARGEGCTSPEYSAYRAVDTESDDDLDDDLDDDAALAAVLAH